MAIAKLNGEPDFARHRAAELVIQDAQDDYFPDPWHLRDLRNLGAPSVLASKSQPPIEAFVPKTELLRRRVVLFPVEKRLLYADSVWRIAEVLGHLFSDCCFSVPRISPESPSFGGAVKRWIRFNDAFREELIDGPNWGVVTDVASYFENVSLPRLSRLLSDLTSAVGAEALAPTIRRVVGLLRESGASRMGLPQNTDFSSFLGNVYLLKFDAFCSGLEARVFRYSDDIRIVSKDRASVVRTFGEIQRFLRTMGLHLNSEKTKLLEPSTPAWLDAISGEANLALAEIDERFACPTPDSDAISLAIKRGLETPDLKRNVRAFCNRALRLRTQGKVNPALESDLQSRAIRGMFDDTTSVDLWSKILAPDRTHVPDVISILNSANSDHNEWVDFWLTKWFQALGHLSGSVVDFLLNRAQSGHWLSRCAAIMALGEATLYPESEVASLMETNPCDFVFRAAMFSSRHASAQQKELLAVKLSRATGFVSHLDHWCGDEGREAQSTEPSRLTFGRIGDRIRKHPAQSGGADYE